MKHNLKIIELPEEKEEEFFYHPDGTKFYKTPKVMWVWGENKTKHKRVVFAEKIGRFLAWAAAETAKGSSKATDVISWEYAEETTEPTIHELTMDEIAERLNIPVENLKIKK